MADGNRLQQSAKQPPHSLEAEQSVLGAMMLDNSRIDDLRSIVSEDDFYREDHRLIFRAICGLYDGRQPADMLTVSEHLKAHGQLDDAGGLAYVGSLVHDTPSVANATAYSEMVRDRAMLRQLIGLGGDITELGYRPDGKEGRELLDEIERKVFALRQRSVRQNTGPVELAHLVELAERGIESRKGAADGITGLPTGIAKLDAMTTGLHPGDLVVIGGRPSSGKTSLAVNIAEHCAFICRKPALIFSMEMPGEQLALRIMSSQSRVPLQALRSGRLDILHWDNLTSGGMRLREAPIRIDDTGSLSPSELRSRARREAMRQSLGLIVVDYLQLMQVPGSKDNRNSEIAEISRALKALAKELRVPIVALSQLNRGVEARDNKRPRMSDLRESGGIEQDADLIAFIYRDEVYHPSSAYAGTAEIIVGKQRNGPLGMVRSAWLAEFCRFENLATDWEAPQESEASPAQRRGGWGKKSNGSTHAAHAAPID